MIDPKEIDEVKFETALRGYSKKEVDHYLEEISDRVTEENARYAELERKYAALKIQIEDIKSAAEEEHAENERLRAEAVAELSRACEEAETIVAAAREEEKQTALRAKFDADKAVAAAKREAMLLADDAKQKAKAVELASHRAADRVIGDAKREAAVIVSNAKRRGEEMILNAQASVESERRLFMKLREEIIARSGEMSRLLTGQLTDIAEFTDRVRRTSFGDIPVDREELLERFADEAKAEIAAEEEIAPEEDAPVSPEEEIADVTDIADEADLGDISEEDSVPEEEVAAEENTAVLEDDDTYDFEGYPEEVGASVFTTGDIPTQEYDGIPQTRGELSATNSSRALTDEELDRIFSFDVEEILNNDD